MNSLSSSVTQVYDKTGKPVEVKIGRTINKYGHETYKMYDLDGNPIGYTKLKVLGDKNAFNDEGFILNQITSYGKLGNDKYAGRVYIDLMENSTCGAYKNVGTKLHQIAVERSLQKGFQGRVQMDASWNSHGFHYNKGFRVMMGDKSEAINQQIVNILKEAKANGTKPDTERLGAVQMYLPYNKINDFKTIISRNPILK